MVDDVPVVATTLDDGVMAGARRHLRILLQNLSDAAERTQRRVADGIAHAVVGAAPASFAPHEVVLPIALQHERTFDIVLGRHLLIGFAIREGNDAQQRI